MKTCNWNCVYCQLGRTSAPKNERHDYFSPEDIIGEVKAALAARPQSQIDCLTFVGSGEPTLHASLGWMIAELKSFTDISIAVITNGSLLYQSEVRDALMLADAVLPTLDAGSERLYQRIDRPMRELTFARLIDGMIAFRSEFEGQVWIEVMLVAGLNDSVRALTDLAAVVRRIQPDQVHINLPVRPPALASVEVPAEASLSRARAILGSVAQVVHHTDVGVDLAADDDLADAICGLVRRHPMTNDELIEALNHEPSEVHEALNGLRSRGNVREVIRHGKRFWSSAASQYARHAPAVN